MSAPRSLSSTKKQEVQNEASYLDQLLAGCCNRHLLLPFVELSHDEISVLVSQSLAARFGRR